MSNRNTLFILLAFIMTLFSCKKEQGCTDITACNYSSSAEEDDDSCYKPGDDCDEGNNTINATYSNSCNCEGGASSGPGCTESSACNYNANATQSDGSCVYPGDPCNDNDSNTTNDTLNSDCDCVGTVSENGCTESSACNYNANATQSDGSCVYPGDPCNDNDSNTTNDTLNSDCDCVGEPAKGPSCQTTSEGFAEIEIGIFTDAFPYENTLVLVDDFGEILVNFAPVVPPNQNSYNSWFHTGSQNGTQLTLLVTDSYGDGLIAPGYFEVRCLSAGGGEELLLVPATTWDTGNPKNPNTPISISVEFTIP